MTTIPPDAKLICEDLRELAGGQLSSTVSDAALSSFAIAVPDGKEGDVVLWVPDDEESHRLSGFHTKRVSALCLAEMPDNFLFTASSDGIARWTLGRGSPDSLLLSSGDRFRPETLIEAMDGLPAFLCLDAAQTRLAVGCNKTTHIVHAHSGKVLARLEGHGAPVTAAAFTKRSDADSVITIAEDRRFIVYDLTNNCISYQSCIVSSSPFVSLAMEPAGSRCALGSADGKVRVYDLSTSTCRHLHTLSPTAVKTGKARESSKDKEEDDQPVVITSEPAWKRAFALAEDGEEDEEAEAEAEHDHAIIALAFVSHGTARPPRAPSAADDAVRLSAAGGQTTSGNEWQDAQLSAPSLLVATPQCVVEVAMHNLETVGALWTQTDDVPRALDLPPAHAVPLGTLGSCAMLPPSSSSSSTRMVACSAFQPRVWALSASCRRTPRELSDAPQAAFTSPANAPHLLSVFPSARPPPGSALEERSVGKAAGGQPALGGKRESLDVIARKSGVAKDQPVVFKAKVKSSGYGPSKPPAGRGAATASKGKGAAGKENAGGGGAQGMLRAYPRDSEAPRHRQSEVDAGRPPQHSGAIRRVAFSPDAGRVATASADQTIGVLRTPLRKHAGDGTFLTGHTGAVASVAWSLDGSQLLSAAADKTVRLWAPTGAASEAVMVIDGREQEVQRSGSASGAAAMAAKTPSARAGAGAGAVRGFAGEVCESCFFFMDRFAVAGVGSEVLLWSLHFAEEDARNDIERLKRRHRYKLRLALQSPAKAVTAIACVNSFLSHLVLSAGSNRDIAAWDAATGQLLYTFKDAHDRPVHCLRLNESSPFASHPSESYDLFVSAATDGVVALWDLRAGSRVARFAGHQSRTLPVGASLSPCLRFLACGSEDRMAYLFDIRAGTGTYLERLPGHSDAVTDAVFNPLHPQLVTACVDGRVRSFADKA